MSSPAAFQSPPAFSRLRGEHLTHFYGDITPVVDASFDASAGDCIALVGANGVGKSTLLRIIATLLRPSEGRIVADDDLDVFEHRGVFRPHVGWVGHDVMLYPNLTGRENLELWTALHGCDPGRVDAWLEATGVQQASGRPVGTWSRGMKQRLSLARSLIHEPSLVLWDEPSSGLDTEGQQMLAEFLRELVDAGRICVLITHQLDAVPDAVNRVWKLARGEVFEDG